MGAVVGAVSGVAGGVLGAITGSQGSKSSQNSTSGIKLRDADGREINSFNLQDSSLSNIRSLLNAGPNDGDYAAGNQSTRDLASLLKQYSQSGGLPNQNDISQANGIASNLFSARQTALDQSFTDQNTEAQRLAARLGRPINDPILQAKLRTGFIRQSDLLNSEKSSAAQQLALQLPGQRLGYAQQATGVLNNFGNQALANQQYLFGLGNSIGNQERNFRLKTSDKYSNSSTNLWRGLSGAISGAIGGAGSGLRNR
jgi:hypothetical protein